MRTGGHWAISNDYDIQAYRVNWQARYCGRVYQRNWVISHEMVKAMPVYRPAPENIFEAVARLSPDHSVWRQLLACTRECRRELHHEIDKDHDLCMLRALGEAAT